VLAHAIVVNDCVFAEKDSCETETNASKEKGHGDTICAGSHLEARGLDADF
jgi:hypothetical protein